MLRWRSPKPIDRQSVDGIFTPKARVADIDGGMAIVDGTRLFLLARSGGLQRGFDWKFDTSGDAMQAAEVLAEYMDWYLDH